MTRLIGSSALLVAFGMAVFGLIFVVLGVRRRRPEWVRTAYSALYVNAGLLLVANIAMVWALVTHDFSVSYVAQVGSRTTPLWVSIVSLWAALEGSILFWGLVLSGYAAAVVWLNRRYEGNLVPYAAATLFGVCIFFFLLLIGPANPFELVWPAPLEGPGPNPLLQNHYLMAIHPPLLYLGYVGLTVPFAFATGALISREMGPFWITATRRWTLAAWAFLSAAIVAGMWWSYEVLGWGGYWAWDPVENASLLPWLTATAFLHSLMVEERRGMLRLWNVSLVIATFLLTILGTFLTRSGVLSSVHAFADGPIGSWFLAFMAIGLILSLVLVAGRSDELRSDGRLDSAASRETVFMVNNLLLTAFTFTVLLGTLYPLVAEALRGEKVSVGAPFFNRMTLPLCVSLIFLMGVGPALPWRAATREQIRRQLLAPGIALVVVAAACFALGVRDVYALLAFAFGAFALTTNLSQFVRGTRARMQSLQEGAPTALARLVRSNNRRYGGYTAHVGVVVLVIGIAASSAFRYEEDATLRPGESVTVKGHTVRFDEIWGRSEPRRFVVGADLSVMNGERRIGGLDARLNFYRMSETPIATPGVRTRASGDLYVTLLAFERDGSTATLRVLVEPLVMWIWVGGGIIGMGALISLWPAGRRRSPPPIAPRAPVVAAAVPPLARRTPERVSAGVARRKLAPPAARPAEGET